MIDTEGGVRHNADNRVGLQVLCAGVLCGQPQDFPVLWPSHQLRELLILNRAIHYVKLH